MFSHSIVISVLLLSGSGVYAIRAEILDFRSGSKLGYALNDADLQDAYIDPALNLVKIQDIRAARQYAMIDNPMPIKSFERAYSRDNADNVLSSKTQASPVCAPCCTTEVKPPCAATEVKPPCATTATWVSSTVIAAVPTAAATATAVVPVDDHEDVVVVDDEDEDDLYTTPSTTKTSSGSALNNNSVVSVAALGFCIAMAMMI